MTSSNTTLSTPLSLPKAAKHAGLSDFIAGFKLWQMVIYLGWEDVRQRYVRTFLGPLWLIIGTAVWIGVMGFVMASLFGHDVRSAMPFISVGMVLWTFIAATLNDGCMLFLQSARVIHAVHLPLSVHVLRFLVRNFIVFMHNFLILVVIFICCQVQLNAYTLLAIPGFLILMLNAIWVGCLLGMLNTRYRDIQQVITMSMTILPFVTPIFWERSFLKTHTWIAMVNPFYHAIEIVRAPLLGQVPPMISWQVMIAMTLVGGMFTLAVFSKYKNRIIYWL